MQQIQSGYSCLSLSSKVTHPSVATPVAPMVDNVVKIKDALARLLPALGWPLVLIVALIWLAPALRELIKKIHTISGKGAGVEVSISTEQRGRR
jgi:hypothetical protein